MNRYAYMPIKISELNVLCLVLGSELQICPRGLTCCTEEMEKKLWIVSKDQYGKAIQSSASSMQRLFHQRSNKFDGKFLEKNYLLIIVRKF